MLLLPLSASGQADPAADAYSVQEFVDLREHADAEYDRFEALDADSDDRTTVAREALRQRIRLVDYLSDWQEAGTMPQALVNSAVESQFVIYQNIVKLYAELVLCDDARSSADVMQELMRGQRLTPTARQALTEARANVVECETAKTEALAARQREERRRVAAQEAADRRTEERAEAEAQEAQNVAQDLDDAHKKHKVVGISLLSAGAATAIGAVVWGISGSNANGDRDALFETSCNSGGICDPDAASQFDSLGSQVKAARIGTIALGVTSATLITSGLVVWLRSSGSDNADVAARSDFGVSFSRHGAYAQFTTSF